MSQELCNERPPISRQFTHILMKDGRSAHKYGAGEYPKNWTPEEDETLRAVFPAGGIKPTMSALPHRRRKAIYTRLRKLNIKRDGWTTQDGPRLAAFECKPRHCRGLEEGEREWYAAQQRAFADAMLACPDERPSSYAFGYNGAGSSR